MRSFPMQVSYPSDARGARRDHARKKAAVPRHLRPGRGFTFLPPCIRAGAMEHQGLLDAAEPAKILDSDRAGNVQKRKRL